MSNVLAHIRVTETHGIRRFLYPLNAVVELPIGIDPQKVALADETGQGVPTQITPWHKDNHRFRRLDFAVSLAPYETLELTLYGDVEPVGVSDPLHVREEDGLFQSRQERFFVALGWDGSIGKVLYDGIQHLRKDSDIRLNGEKAVLTSARSSGFEHFTVGLPLCIRVEGDMECAGRAVLTSIEATACKSWVKIARNFWAMNKADEVAFTLPFAITSPTLTCDFGVGGYVFGKLQADAAEEIVLRTKFTEDGMARWTVATAGRVDYVGEALSEDFLSQRWFHLIDSDKALAVAITDVPSECAEMTVTLRTNGDVIVAFRLGDVAQNTAVKFGVCYHFLNDVPAIAAATNPQSILLPPTVEVLAT
jgi:hypothetical protein